MRKDILLEGCSSCYWRKLLLVVLLCVLCSMGYSKPSKVDSLVTKMNAIEQQIVLEKQEIMLVKKELELCEKEQSAICEHVDRANEKVSNQIAASSHTIQVWGIVIAVLAIVISIIMSVAGIVFARYINKMRKNIVLLTSDAKKQLKKAETASEEIADQQSRLSAQQQEIKIFQDATEKNVKELQQLHSDIQNNMNAIYARLRREETISILKRLEEIPEDMFNTEDVLLARDLEKEDYSYLLKAYHALIQQRMELNDVKSIADLRNTDFKFQSLEGSYILLFAQHFMDKAIEDSELREIMLTHIDTFYKGNFFRNDAIKSTDNYKRGVLTLDETLQTTLIIECISAIIGSPYEKMTELYANLLKELKEQQLNDIWEGVTKRTNNALYFAESIKEKIEDINSQSVLLEKIADYIKHAETEKD